jgi:hypothetical protein
MKKDAKAALRQAKRTAKKATGMRQKFVTSSRTSKHNSDSEGPKEGKKTPVRSLGQLNKLNVNDGEK